MNASHLHRKSSGFTLAELLVSLSVITVVGLAAITLMITGYTLFTKNASINLSEIQVRHTIVAISSEINKAVSIEVSGADPRPYPPPYFVFRNLDGTILDETTNAREDRSFGHGIRYWTIVPGSLPNDYAPLTDPATQLQQHVIILKANSTASGVVSYDLVHYTGYVSNSNRGTETTIATDLAADYPAFGNATSSAALYPFSRTSFPGNTQLMDLNIRVLVTSYKNALTQGAWVNQASNPNTYFQVRTLAGTRSVSDSR